MELVNSRQQDRGQTWSAPWRDCVEVCVCDAKWEKWKISFLFHNKMMKIKQTKIVEGETPMEMLLTV